MTPSESWREVLDAALAQRGVDHLAAITVQTLERESPLLREDPDLRELARRSAAANLALVAELVRGAVPLAGVEPPPQAVAFARELARRNVPMSELARAYRVGQHVMWRFGVGEVRAGLTDQAAIVEAIEAYTDATFATGEVMMASVLERYTLERDRWVRSADAVRRATVQALLDGAPTDPSAAGARLRYELRREHVGFVVWADTDEAGVESAAVSVGGAGSLVVPLGAGVIGGWCPPAALDPDAAGRGVHVAIGLPGEGVEGFRRTHVEALEARRVARLGPGLPDPVRYQDVALVALLTKDPEQSRAFALGVAGGLAGAEPRLADTVLEVLAAQGSPRRAAQRLAVHENTVAKRVRAAEALLGHPIDTDPPALLAALLILRATRERGQRP
jgi:hypothetical protein